MGNIENNVAELIRWKTWQMRLKGLAATGVLVATGALVTGIVVTILFLSGEFVDITVVFVGLGAGLILLAGMAYGIIMTGYHVRKSRILRSNKEAIVDHLVGRVQNKEYGPYQTVIMAISDIGNGRATASMAEALRDENEDVRTEAAQTLGNIGDSRAIEPLVVAMEDKAFLVRLKAAKALNKLGWRPIDDAEEAHYLVAKSKWDLLAGLGQPAIDPLIQVLKDEKSFVRWGAAGSLGKIGDAQAGEPLIAALKDEDNSVRSAAAQALGEIGDAQAVEPLIAALKDEEDLTREAAGGALKRMGDAVVGPLIAALKDEYYYVRWYAAGALGEIGDAQAVEPLIAALKDKDHSVRQAAREALQGLRTRQGGDHRSPPEEGP